MRLTNLLHVNFSVRLLYFWTVTGYDCETCRVCTIEDGDYFGKVELRLTPGLRKEMRLTINFQCILSRLTPMIVDKLFIV